MPKQNDIEDKLIAMAEVKARSNVIFSLLREVANADQAMFIELLDAIAAARPNPTAPGKLDA